jgi:Glyoxalase/Bleomycin resistance protein/Dioxygenase superfamily
MSVGGGRLVKGVDLKRWCHRSVFGWSTLDLGNGEFWTLPAYGDYLEQLTPGTREQTAELGPPGFEEVVAAITPITGDDADTSAYWGVTFSTGDADATAAKAVELGGSVVANPVDAPYSRLTEIRDPQGATFSATACCSCWSWGSHSSQRGRYQFQSPRSSPGSRRSRTT